jgi:hypothetical protein
VTGSTEKVVSEAAGGAGGAVEQSGVGSVVEGAVNEVAGTESNVGAAAGDTVKSVGGLLGEGH